PVRAAAHPAPRRRGPRAVTLRPLVLVSWSCQAAPAGFRRVRRSRRARPARAVGPPTGRGALVPRLPAPHGQVGAGGAVVRAPASGSPTGTAVRQPLKIALWSTAVGYGGPPGWAAHPVRTDVRIRAGVWGRRQGSG